MKKIQILLNRATCSQLLIKLTAITLLCGCNLSELAVPVESDDVKLYNEIIVARNSIWAEPLKTDTDLLRAKSKLVKLKDINYVKASPELKLLCKRLIKISDQKLEIISQLREITKDIDDYNQSGFIDRLLSKSRIEHKVDQTKELANNLRKLSSDFDEWDESFKLSGQSLKR